MNLIVFNTAYVLKISFYIERAQPRFAQEAITHNGFSGYCPLYPETSWAIKAVV